MVGQDIANVQVGVRFSMAAQIMSFMLLARYIRILLKTVDNHVSNVYKGHNWYLSFRVIFAQNILKNKAILLKDTKF